MDYDRAQALAQDLHERTLQVVQTQLAPLMSEASNAAAQIDELNRRKGAFTGRAQIDALTKEIDQLPPAVAQAAFDPGPNPEDRVIPDSTVNALHSALKYARDMSHYGLDEALPNVKQIRALGNVLYARLAAIDATLGPEQVNQNIVYPSARQYGP